LAEHGGALHAAARRYGIPVGQWLDLSTGINPDGWPVPAVPARVWNRLPESDDALLAAAAAYYGNTQILPLSGSQAAIQGLPSLRAPCRVGVVAPTYFEHELAWRRAGHTVALLAPGDVEGALDQLDVLVLAAPNNPTGWRPNPVRLTAWHECLARRGGWLVVDEAFIDATPEESLVAQAGRPGLAILRSLGKFFGLAGARVGFLFAWPALLEQLADALGPWTVSGPARFVATAALRDRTWQAQTRERLRRSGKRLHDLLVARGLTPDGTTALFSWCLTEHAADLHEMFSRRAVLVRRFETPGSLRFGLPGCEREWRRLDRTLVEVAAEGGWQVDRDGPEVGLSAAAR